MPIKKQQASQSSTPGYRHQEPQYLPLNSLSSYKLADRSLSDKSLLLPILSPYGDAPDAPQLFQTQRAHAHHPENKSCVFHPAALLPGRYP